MINFAICIQSIAQAGLPYGRDVYDKERYEELRNIAAEMICIQYGKGSQRRNGFHCIGRKTDCCSGLAKA
ncbi:NUDIX hydrolase N-terminal domain-containing protein [Lachnoclostridium sp. Marseille-P6806]|uniref:NUDIX hydrolase N-terminal domain-containing protein n=1 Tax=Lachnoclostridium sp. Marseille-P6806 TaxID=2364793 RepID=UPI001F5FA877|nr:NUDIX hydrolase N-terminal domain-containing protein [Lachnoclostridium sp. Marseille-P6806]